MVKVPKKNIAREITDVKRRKGRIALEDVEGILVGDDGGYPERTTRSISLFKMLFLFATVAVLIIGGAWLFLPGTTGENMFKERLAPLLHGDFKTYSDIGKVSLISLRLLQKVSALEHDLPQMLFKGEGDKLIASLGSIRGDLVEADDIFSHIKEGDLKDTGALGNFILGAGNNQLSLSLEVHRLRVFADALVTYLSSSEPRRILVLLGNPSEMRPGGGFIGSVAEVTLQGGSVKELTVRDINEIDRTLEARIVPPKPLQGIETWWHSANTNWFFDFKDSGEQVLSLVERSKLYSEKDIHFDGVVSISPRVVADFLALVGPITLEGEKEPITSENVAAIIQNSVQENQANGVKTPKAILTALAPKLVEAFTAKPEGAAGVAGMFREWISKKELVFYSRIKEFQDTAEHFSAGGRVSTLPANFNGDFFALAEAGISGGKSDGKVETNVTFETQLDASGKAMDRVTVSRAHQAKASDPWWERVTNESFLQFFVPSSSEAIAMSGGVWESIAPRLSYKNAGYETDPELLALEGTREVVRGISDLRKMQEYGRTVFATWLRTPRVSTSTLTLEYEHRLFAPPADGVEYTFILDHQTQVRRTYHLVFNAPVGFVWKENNLPIYEQEIAEPDARTAVTLTLKKNS